MGDTTTRRPRRSSIGTVETWLAGLLLALVALYGIGTVAEGRLPPVHDAGVLAVHVAVVVGLVVPTVVLGRACHGAIAGAATPRPAAIGLALLGVGGLAASLVVDATAIAVDGTPPFAVGTVALLALAAVVVADRWRDRRR